MKKYCSALLVSAITMAFNPAYAAPAPQLVKVSYGLQLNQLQYSNTQQQVVELGKGYSFIQATNNPAHPFVKTDISISLENAALQQYRTDLKIQVLDKQDWQTLTQPSFVTVAAKPAQMSLQNDLQSAKSISVDITVSPVN